MLIAMFSFLAMSVQAQTSTTTSAGALKFVHYRYDSDDKTERGTFRLLDRELQFPPAGEQKIRNLEKRIGGKVTISADRKSLTADVHLASAIAKNLDVVFGVPAVSSFRFHPGDFFKGVWFMTPPSGNDHSWYIESEMLGQGMTAVISGPHDDKTITVEVDDEDSTPSQAERIKIAIVNGKPQIIQAEWYLRMSNNPAVPPEKRHDFWNRRFQEQVGDLPDAIRPYLTPEIAEQIKVQVKLQNPVKPKPADVR